MLKTLDLVKKIEYLLNELNVSEDGFLNMLHRSSIDRRTLRGWFKKSAVGNYLNHHSKQNIQRWMKDQHKIDFKYDWFNMPLSQFMLEAGLQVESPKASAIGNAEGYKPETAQRQLQSLVGTYQIIRPYTSMSDRYVVEPMQIRQDALAASAKNMLMYSHNHASRTHLYEGECLLSSRYGYALLSRPHEQNNEGIAMRCIQLHIDSADDGDRFRPIYCLSGIMLRGVMAKKLIGKMAVAVPFIALRPLQSEIDLAEPQFEVLRPKLRRMGSGILLGEVSNKNARDVFDFCHQMFRDLTPRLHSGLVLQTIHPSDIEEEIEPEGSAPGAPFETWRSLVDDLEPR